MIRGGGPPGVAGATGTSLNWIAAGWDPVTTFAAYDALSYGGSSYVALASSTNVVPGTDGTKWGLVALQGAAGANGASGTPGSTYGAALLTGGGVKWNANYGYTVAAATYVINGTAYSSAETEITLTAADGALDRIDLFALTSSGTAIKVDGTAAANPAEPSLDPLTQLKVGLVLVGAGTAAATIGATSVYAENTEWTSSKSGAPIELASTTNPHGGTKDIEATSAVAGNYFQLTDSGAFDTTTRNILAFYIRSKAAWPSQKSLVIQWNSAGVAKGTPVTLKTGAYGFNSGTTGSYQLIVIPLSAFGVAGVSVDGIRFTVSGGGSAIGFYVDDISLQGGVTQTSPTDAMRWRGTYSAAAQYILNDVVMYSGRLYIALQSVLGVTPTGAGWTALGFNPAIPGAIGGTTPAAGTFTTLADSKGDVRLIPQNSQSAAYTTVLADAGKHLLHPAADTNARTFTIDSNANVAYTIGTAITFVNQTANVVSIAITSDTLTLAGSTTTGTRSLAQNGIATALKITSTGWIISGTGLS